MQRRIGKEKIKWENIKMASSDMSIGGVQKEGLEGGGAEARLSGPPTRR